MISKKSFYIPAYQVSFFEGRLKDSEHTAVQNEKKYVFLWKISWYKQFLIRFEVQDNEAVFKKPWQNSNSEKIWLMMLSIQ